MANELPSSIGNGGTRTFLRFPDFRWVFDDLDFRAVFDFGVTGTILPFRDFRAVLFFILDFKSIIVIWGRRSFPLKMKLEGEVDYIW